VSKDLVCHFGKHEGVDMSNIPSGYLRWALKTIDPVPEQKYRIDADGNPLSAEEVKEMEEKMRTFLFAAEDELDRREKDGEKDEKG